MKRLILIAHAKGEEAEAEKLAQPIRDAGYEVTHQGTLLVGDSMVEEASKALAAGAAVVVCATVKAMGTKWAVSVTNAARSSANGTRIFGVRMEEDADIERVTFDTKVAEYYEDPANAMAELLEALKTYYPLDQTEEPLSPEAERQYRTLALQACDIINLANLPDNDRLLATRTLELRRLYLPTRVRVEAERSGDAKEKLLEKLEKRRERERLRAAGRIVRDTEADPEEKRYPVGERLRTARRLVVLGDPGAGKTTMLRWVATAYLLKLKRDPAWNAVPDVETLPDEDWLPIVVRCRELNEESLTGTLDDILKHVVRHAELQEPEATLRTALKRRLHEGTAILLLDGLDEITDPRLRARFCEQVEQISRAFEKAPMIITSRIVGYKEMGYRFGNVFEHVTVADLSREEKDDFARRWCELTETPERKKEATEELIHDIHSSDRIEKLTGNPMLLTTMALVKRKVGRLPNQRAKLYGHAVEVLLNWRRELDAPLDDREAIPQLEYAAYEMCRRGAQQLREDELLELFERMRKEYPNVRAVQNHTAEEFLHLLEARAGIMVEAGRQWHLGIEMPVYEFRHLTLQEYLAARALVDGKFPERDASRSLAEQVGPLAGETVEVEISKENVEVQVTENWREALQLCMSICLDDDADVVLEAIGRPLEREEPGNAKARATLAVQCLVDEPNVSKEVAQQTLERWALRLDKQDNSFPRGSAYDVLMRLGGTRWSDLVANVLTGEYKRRSGQAREEVEELFGGVFGALLQEQTPIAQQAEWAKQFKEGDEDDMIRVGLSVFLGRKSLPIDQWVNAIERAIGLGDAAGQAIAFAARYASAFRLMSKDKYARAELEKIVHIIQDSDVTSWIRSNLIRCLMALQFTGAQEPLLLCLNEMHANVRSAAATALGQLGDARAVEPLMARLADMDSDVQNTAATALGRLGHAHTVEPLMARLADMDSDVRSAAATALGRLGDARAVEPLMARLADGEPNVRRAAATALGQLGDARAVEPLMARLADMDSDVQNAAATALGQLGDARAIERLMARLAAVEPYVRSVAATALEQLGDARAVEPLVACLADAEPYVRSTVAEALGQLGDARAVEPLMACLADAEPYVGNAAATALGQLGDARAVEPLVAHLADEEPTMRGGVAQALDLLGDVRGKTALEVLRASDNPNERKAYVRVMALGNRDKTVKILLSRDLDGIDPFLDPQKIISTKTVTQAMQKLRMGEEEVKTKYAEAAVLVGMKVEWQRNLKEE